MELTVALTISIVGVIISVSSFVLARKDKSNKDVKEEQKEFSKHDLIEYRLKKIDEQLEKISNKLDKYEKDIDDRVTKAIHTHEMMYHNVK